MQSHEPLARQILQLRGQRVILDLHLAQLCGVQTKRLDEQVRRNAQRFPQEFSFVLANPEVANLKSQYATSSDTLSANAEIARRLDQLQRKAGAHDHAILEILQALRQLAQPAQAPKRRRIGFVQD